MSAPNHPVVVWVACFLWLASLCTIIWALILFFYFADMLLMTGTDLVVATALLSGLIMLPTNVHMLYSIANGQKINHQSKVLCCPLWMCMLWVIVINCVGVILCLQKIRFCDLNTIDSISHGMKNYRNVPKYKHFIDNLQWSLKCCGKDSYKDWFNHDWYGTKLRDYEWGPSKNKQRRNTKKEVIVSDSVPLSCCKSGTCVPNYLLELGTNSVYTRGCSSCLYLRMMMFINCHLIVFCLITISEVFLLKYIMGKCDSGPTKRNQLHDVRHLMPINNNFDATSGSSSCSPNESYDLEASRHRQLDKKETPVNKLQDQ